MPEYPLLFGLQIRGWNNDGIESFVANWLTPGNKTIANRPVQFFAGTGQDLGGRSLLKSRYDVARFHCDIFFPYVRKEFCCLWRQFQGPTLGFFGQPSNVMANRLENLQRAAVRPQEALKVQFDPVTE